MVMRAEMAAGVTLELLLAVMEGGVVMLAPAAVPLADGKLKRQDLLVKMFASQAMAWLQECSWCLEMCKGAAGLQNDTACSIR